MITEKRTIIAYALSIITLIMLREYWLFMRQGLHVDESMSFILSAYNPHGFDKPFPGVIHITGDQLRHAMWFNDTSFASMLVDLKNLWVFTRDTPHSNLYYSLLRIWFTGTVSDKLYFTMLWAVQLNIMLVAASMLIFCFIAYEISKNHVVTISSMVVGFICYESISNTIFARPYQLQETMTLAFLAMTMVYMRNVICDNRFVLAYSAVTAFTILTGYFAVVYVFITMLMVLGYAVVNCEKKYKRLVVVCFKFSTTTLLLAYLIYPPYFFVGGGRQTEALSKLEDVLDNLSMAYKTFFALDGYHPYFWFSMTIAICCMVLAFLNQRFKSNIAFFSIAISSVLIWWAFVMTFAPYKVPRYVYPALPVLALVYCLIMSTAFKVNKHIGFVICAFIVAISIHTYASGKVSYAFDNKKPYCDIVFSGKTIYMVSAAYRLNGLTDCLPDTEVTIVSNTKQMDDEMKTGNYEYVVSDKPLDNLTKIEFYGYFYVYKTR